MTTEIMKAVDSEIFAVWFLISGLFHLVDLHEGHLIGVP